MLSNPKPSQRAQLWYREKLRPIAPDHGRVGTVRVVARGKGPRNHGVEIEGRLVIVPAGHLREPREG